MASSEPTAQKESKLCFPRELSIFTRMHLWLRGYHDARRQRVLVFENGTIGSRYCETLALKANHQLVVEWQDCNGFLFQIRPNLEAALLKYSDVVSAKGQLCREKAKQLEGARVSRAGDYHVEETLASRRRLRREELVERKFAAPERELRSRELKACSEIDELVANCQDAVDVAETHDQLIRMEYIAKLSCYCRGASRVVDLHLAQINDSGLDDRPQQSNIDYFKQSISQALTVKQSILKAKTATGEAGE